MKLQKKEVPRLKSKRPGETKHISLERIASGTVTATSEVLFQVKFSRKTREEKYNKPKTKYPELDEEEKKYIKKEEYILFRKKDASEYNPPRMRMDVRCIYNGDKNNLLPYAVYDLNWNLLWKEKTE